MTIVSKSLVTGDIRSGYGGPAARFVARTGPFFSPNTRERTMAKFGRPKLSDAVHRPSETGKKKRGKPTPAHEVTAEQVREAEESAKARAAEASNRDRMVDIGRGNQQAGRQSS
jgi:hypothetical protein